MNKILLASIIGTTMLFVGCNRQVAPIRDMDNGMHRMPDGSMMMDGSMDDMNHEMPDGSMMDNDDMPGMKMGGGMMDSDEMACCKKCMGGMNCMMMAGGDSMDHGNMTMDDMVKMLEGKTGDELDKAFLEGMIPHHQGAIDMAEFLLKHAKHEELRQLGRDIIEAQQREIDMMKQWQKDWGYVQ